MIPSVCTGRCQWTLKLLTSDEPGWERSLAAHVTSALAAASSVENGSDNDVSHNLLFSERR